MEGILIMSFILMIIAWRFNIKGIGICEIVEDEARALFSFYVYPSTWRLDILWFHIKKVG